MSKEEDFVTDCRVSIERIAIKLGVSGDVAALIAAEWDAVTRSEWACCQPYIATRKTEFQDAKRRAVDEASRSGRVAEAAERHGISRATMYRLLKK
jgi:transcriptional regulator of acetoin/glycerol metabolism